MENRGKCTQTERDRQRPMENARMTSATGPGIQHGRWSRSQYWQWPVRLLLL